MPRQAPWVRALCLRSTAASARTHSRQRLGRGFTASPAAGPNRHLTECTLLLLLLLWPRRCRAQPCQTPTPHCLPPLRQQLRLRRRSRHHRSAAPSRRCARPARTFPPACVPPPRGSPVGHAPLQRAHGSGRKPKPTPSHCSFSLLAMSGTVSISCPINRPTVRGSNRRAESETAIAQCSTSCSRPSTPGTLANG